MRSICLAFALWAAGANLALAQTPSETTPPHQLVLAERLVELTMGDEVGKILEDFVDGLIASTPSMEDSHARWFRGNLPGVMVDLIDDLGEQLAPAYAEGLAQDELEALVAFYDTPIGRSIANKSMRIGIESGPALESLLQTHLISMMDKFCAEFDCNDPGLGASRSKH